MVEGGEFSAEFLYHTHALPCFEGVLLAELLLRGGNFLDGV